MSIINKMKKLYLFCGTMFSLRYHIKYKDMHKNIKNVSASCMFSPTIKSENDSFIKPKIKLLFL